MRSWLYIADIKCGIQRGLFRNLSQRALKLLLLPLFRTQVVLPYIKDLSQRVRRSFLKHGITSAFKPHQTLRNCLVHPKDKRDISQICECVYEIPCHNCNKTYIGETSRLFGTRLKEHKTEAENLKHQRKPLRGPKENHQSQGSKINRQSRIMLRTLTMLSAGRMQPSRTVSKID